MNEELTVKNEEKKLFSAANTLNLSSILRSSFFILHLP